MTTQAIDQPPADETSQSQQPPGIRKIPISAPAAWLKQAWATFLHAPAPSLLYGFIFSAACFWIASLMRDNPGFTSAFLTGLLLIAPVLATGLFVATRQHEQGQPVSISSSLRLIWDRRDNLGLFMIFLALVMAAWVRLSALIFAFKVNAFAPTDYSWQGFLSGSFDPIIVGFFVVIGAILALAVFVTSAVAIPMIADRDVGPITAMTTSYRAVKENPGTMALWAATIVALTAVGVFSWFVAMVVIFPLLGYATWYSYRDLVE